MLPRWCVPLRSGRELLGYLWVLNGDEAVTEAQLPQIVACADLAAMYLAQTPMTSEGRGRRRAALLARLAAGRDHDAARELIALEELDPASTVAVNAPRATDGWPLRGEMSVHVNPRAAVTSGPPLPLAELHLAVRRALLTRQALRAGAALARPAWDALGSWHLIVAAPPDLAVADVHPGAEVLARQARPDLMITARTVLDHGGDIARAAAAAAYPPHHALLPDRAHRGPHRRQPQDQPAARRPAHGAAPRGVPAGRRALTAAARPPALLAASLPRSRWPHCSHRHLESR